MIGVEKKFRLEKGNPSGSRSYESATLRHKNIVYISTWKCAGTFFTKFFKKNGWELIEQSLIKKSDIIFTFIIEPGLKRIKGITELLRDSNIRSDIGSKEFKRFIKHIVIGDYHTIPYHLQYQFFNKRVIFLPLQDWKLSPFKILKEFFKVHLPDQHIDKYDKNIPPNAGHQHEYKDVSKLLDHKLSNFILYKDFVIYNTMIRKLNRNFQRYIAGKDPINFIDVK